MRPGVRQRDAERDGRLPRRAARHGVARVEAAVEAAFRRDADAEVRAHLRHVVRHRRGAVDGAALQDRLRAVKRFGLDPGLDGELAERVVGLVVQAVGAAGLRDGGRLLAREPDRLAAVGIRELEGVRTRRGRPDLFVAVGDPVAVRIVTLVLLEGEEEVLGGAVARLARARREGPVEVEILVLRVVLRRVARQVRSGGVRHPQRRRVRVGGLRAGHVDDERFLEVADAVAVGVGLGRSHHPRILQRVEEAVGAVAHPVGHAEDPRPAHPGVVPEADVERVVAVGGADQVAHDHPAFQSVHDGAEQRVEAVEELVVVVHVVAVGVPQARVGAGVAERAQGGAFAEKRRRRQHDAVAARLSVVFGDILREARDGGGIPRAGRPREVAERAEVVGGREGGEAGVDRRRAEGLAVHVVHLQEADELLARRRAVRHRAAHEGRHRVVVAQVAERLRQVFLEVLQAVLVEVEVATRARARVGGVAERVGRIRGVHAARDVVALRGRAVLQAVGAADQLERGAAQAAVRPVGREEQARVAHFPRVGQAVAVGIHRAGVHAAAAHAVRRGAHRRLRLTGLVVDEREAVAEAHRLAEAVVARPVAAFHVVADAVAVRIAVPRVDGPELVHPAGRAGGQVGVDRLDARVGVAGVRARELRGEAHARAVELLLVVPGARVRVEAHVERPAVGHAVLARVGAVVLVGVLRAAFLGVDLGERDVRVRGAAEEDVADRVLLRLDRREVAGEVVCLVGRIARVVLGEAGQDLRRVAVLRRRHVAVLQEQVFVGGGVRHGVHRLALHVVPAVVDAVVGVLEPRRARIEAELGQHLVVDHDERLAHRHGDVREVVEARPVDRLRRGGLLDARELVVLGAVRGAGHGRDLVALRPDAAARGHHRRGGVAVAEDGNADGVVRRRLNHRERVRVDEAAAVARKRVRPRVAVGVREGDHGVRRADLHARHEVAVRVGVRRLGDERVQAA